MNWGEEWDGYDSDKDPINEEERSDSEEYESDREELQIKRKKSYQEEF